MTKPAPPEGDDISQDDATWAEYSFTRCVPMAIDDMTGSDHAINIHESDDAIQNYIARGDIGGVIDANGSLVIGLRPQNNSGLTRIAILNRDSAYGTQTDVQVLITGDRLGDDTTDDDASGCYDDAADHDGGTGDDDDDGGGDDDGGDD